MSVFINLFSSWVGFGCWSWGLHYDIRRFHHYFCIFPLPNRALEVANTPQGSRRKRHRRRGERARTRFAQGACYLACCLVYGNLFQVLCPHTGSTVSKRVRRNKLTGAGASLSSSPADESPPSPPSKSPLLLFLASASFSAMASKNLRDSSAEARFTAAVSGDKTPPSPASVPGLAASHRSSCITKMSGERSFERAAAKKLKKTKYHTVCLHRGKEKGIQIPRLPLLYQSSRPSTRVPAQESGIPLKIRCRSERAIKKSANNGRRSQQQCKLKPRR